MNMGLIVTPEKQCLDPGMDSMIIESYESDSEQLIQHEQKELDKIKTETNSASSSDIDEKYRKTKKLLRKSNQLRTLITGRYMKMKQEKKMMKKMQQMKKRIQLLEKERGMFDILEQSVSKIFTSDQIDILKKRYKTIPIWQNASLVNGFRIQFTCGRTGYDELLNQGYPLPALRTLRKKVENLKFKTGFR